MRGYLNTNYEKCMLLIGGKLDCWLKIGRRGIVMVGTWGGLGLLPPLASRLGVGLNVGEIPGRLDWALVVDIYLDKPVVRPVKVVARH